jgi:IstB-like ATP binding protein.
VFPAAIRQGLPSTSCEGRLLGFPVCNPASARLVSADFARKASKSSPAANSGRWRTRFRDEGGFWEICEDRYQTRSTILISRWHEQIGDPTRLTVFLDRLVLERTSHRNA